MWPFNKRKKRDDTVIGMRDAAAYEKRFEFFRCEIYIAGQKITYLESTLRCREEENQTADSMIKRNEARLAGREQTIRRLLKIMNDEIPVDDSNGRWK